MNKFLKIIAICVAFTMMLSSFSVVLANNTTSESVFNEAIELLSILNIISINEDNDDFSANRSVTRGEFCVDLARALNLAEYASMEPVDDFPFIDVSKTDPLSSYIYLLYKKDIISGYNKQFNPDSYITLNEAIKMVVCASGYGVIAESKGGYPGGYMMVANQLDILDGLDIETPEKLTKGDSACILFNMLSADLLKMEGISNAGVQYSKRNDESMLTETYKVYKTRGIVQKNSISSIISDDEPAESGYVTIDGTHYLVGNTNVENLVGYEIEFYYQNNEVEDTKTIILVTDSISDIETLVLDADEIVSFKDGVYTYWDNTTGKEKKVRLTDDFAVLYNGAYPKNNFTAEMMIPTNGAITLVQSATSNGFSTVKIEDYVPHIVNSVDIKNEKIYDKTKQFIDLSGVEYIILREDGTKASLDDIKEWSVLSVLWSSNKSRVVIYISEKVETGTINEINNDGYKHIVVSGKEYTVSKMCLNSQEIQVGLNGDFYFDYKGKIVAVNRKSSTDFVYAYLINIAIKSGLDETVMIKVFDATSEIKTFELSEKININDNRYKDPNNVLNILNNSKKSIVSYKLNSDGLVNEMYINDDFSEDYIHNLYSDRGVYVLKQRSFGGKVTMVENPLVFIVPDGANEEDYEVRTLSNFKNDKFYDVSVYTSGNNVYGEVILCEVSTVSYDRKAAVVTGTMKQLDENDEVVTVLSLMHAGEQKQYMLAKEELLSTIEVGDIIKFSVDTKNRINDILHIYDESNDTLLVSNPYEPQTGAGYRSQDRMLYGYAYLKKDGLLKVGSDMPTDDNYKTADTENALLSEFNLYVIDRSETRDNLKVSLANEGDIVDYAHSGSACSKVIVSTNWGEPEEIFIIK